MVRNAEQCEYLTLQIGELGVEELDDVTLREQRMPLGEAEQAQNLLSGWAFALTLLWIEREFLDFLSLHRKA